MFQSKFFAKTLRDIPKEAITKNHQLLLKGCYINQLINGVWTLNPLGLRVLKKIENIIREEINNIGGQEIFMPTLQSRELLERSGRWEKMDPPLFKFKDRHDKWLALGSTHEEVVTDLAAQYVKSYKDLPLALYQIQNKFRNEMRSSGGLLRVREFVMKDLYSFHITKEDLDQYYEKAKQAYLEIYKRCSLKVIPVEASSGTIGGNYSHEFMVLSESGEDKIAICEKCNWGANSEILNGKDSCPHCGKELRAASSIEAGHIFKLGTIYSEKMGLSFMDADGKQKPVIMGCYGIGVGRLMAIIVECLSDEKGIVWPKSVAPFDVHLLCLDTKDKDINKKTTELYNDLIEVGFDVLFDDRDESAGVKLKDADLIGIPTRLVISQKTGDKVEYKERANSKIELLSADEIIKKLK